MKRSFLLALAILTALLLKGCDNKQSSKNVSKQATDVQYAIAQELNGIVWLAGSWQDASDDMDVEYLTTWELNNKFLKQQFTVRETGEEDLIGTQIIGWDPLQEQIRSWIYDSDGGIGSGSWTQEGNTWYVAVLFIMPDGNVAAATHVYKRINDDEYTFASINRDIEGEIQPNIGPFKVVRKK